MVGKRLDLVIRVGHSADSSYIAIPFAKVNMVLCASPDYLQKYGRPKTLADLNNHNIIIFDKFDKFIFSNDNNQQQITLTGSLVMNSVASIISAVCQDIGLSLLPDLLIQKKLVQGELIEVMPEYKVEIKGLAVDQAFAMYSSRKQMPAKVRAFLDFYKSRF